jgi:hypothetical protein
MRVIWKHLNPTKGWKNLSVFLLIASLLMVSIWLIFAFPNVSTNLQNNDFGLAFDVIVFSIALTLLIVITFGSLASSYGLGEFLGRVCEATLAAMVQMQRLSAQLLCLLAQVIAYIRQISKHFFAAIIPIHSPTKQIPFFPPARFSPLSALPYEHYLETTILLN